MFVEKTSAEQGRIAARLDAFGRRHPALFDALLILLTVVTTIVQLIQVGASFVLYQGF
jgi:hypothetical protein